MAPSSKLGQVTETVATRQWGEATELRQPGAGHPGVLTRAVEMEDVDHFDKSELPVIQSEPRENEFEAPNSIRISGPGDSGHRFCSADLQL